MGLRDLLHREILPKEARKLGTNIRNAVRKPKAEEDAAKAQLKILEQIFHLILQLIFLLLHAIHLLCRQSGFRIRLWGGYWWAGYSDRSGRGTWVRDNM